MLDTSLSFTPAPHTFITASYIFLFAFWIVVHWIHSIGSLGWCIFGLVTVISICFIYTAIPHSITSSSILITHATTSLTSVPLCYLPNSSTPHVTSFSSPFVDIALYLPTYSLHSFPILFIHFRAITSLIPTLPISLYHSITPPSFQTPTVCHPVAVYRHPVETSEYPVGSPADIL